MIKLFCRKDDEGIKDELENLKDRLKRVETEKLHNEWIEKNEAVRLGYHVFHLSNYSCYQRLHSGVFEALLENDKGEKKRIGLTDINELELVIKFLQYKIKEHKNNDKKEANQ